jgi:hypothetical protein
LRPWHGGVKPWDGGVRPWIDSVKPWFGAVRPRSGAVQPRLARGAQGEQGIQGIPGLSGEVTTTAMNGAIATAIAGTANSTNAVATLDTPLADPDSEALRLKINELILAQWR